MAINYTDLFTVLGKIVKAANAYETEFAAMKTNRDTIYDQLSAKNIDYVGDGISTNVSQHIGALSSGISYYIAKAAALLVDPTMVTNHLPVTSNTLNTVLLALYDDMVIQNQSIKRATGMTIGSVNRTSYSLNCGDIAHTPVLDGVNAPLTNAPINILYGDEAASTQLAVEDTIYAKCTNADTEGQETFSIYGNIAVPPFSENAESVGGSITVQTSDEENLLTNGDMETYSGGFTGWTVTLDGTTLSQETTDFHRGASAMKLANLSSSNIPIIKQDISSLLEIRRAYMMLGRLRAASTATGNVEVSCVLKNAAGTVVSNANYMTASAGTILSVEDEDWRAFQSIVLLDYIHDPADVFLHIAFESDQVSGPDIIVDDITLCPVHYFNGYGFVVHNGQERFRLNDRFEIIFSTTEAVFGAFIRKEFAFQRPPAVSPSIADSLAT